MPDEVRVYTVSGVSHAPFRAMTKPVMQLHSNRFGYGALMRALLVALVEWVEHGIAPPDTGSLRAPPPPETRPRRSIQRNSLPLRRSPHAYDSAEDGPMVRGKPFDKPVLTDPR